jgi:putative addiction module component (TIGR02574 family)
MAPTLQELGIERLSPAERLDLIAAIWDSLSDSLEELPMPEWHRRELERRLAACEADPTAGSTWEEVKARLRGQR